jgi:phage tail-like protein
VLAATDFRVFIDDRELGFSEVSRLTSASEAGAPPEQGRHRFETVVLRRALTRSTELYDWRRKILAGADDRRVVTISQLDAPAGSIVNSWRLLRAWPCRWSGPAFNAMTSVTAIEEVELAFDDLVWITDDPEPTQGA